MITRTARFSINEAALTKKLKTCNEEALVLKFEKGKNYFLFQVLVLSASSLHVFIFFVNAASFILNLAVLVIILLVSSFSFSAF